jgi:hypothetical protein
MLNLQPLELRRVRFHLVIYFKLLHDPVLINISSYFTNYIRQFLLAAETLNTLSLTKAKIIYGIVFLLGLLTAGIIYRILCVPVTRCLTLNGA